MENIVQIQLIDTNKGYLNLADETNFPLNFGISDVRDLTKRKGTTSKTIKLAGDKNNNKLLNNYFDVNVIAGTFNINTLQKCAVIENGITILDDVYLQLTRVIKEQPNGQHDQLVSYECLIKDSTSDFFTVIGNNELTDLEMQSLENYHIYNSDNVVASWAHTWKDEYKYVMPINTIDNIYNLEEWLPGIYAKQYWNKIFESAGYRYEWEAHTGITQQFDKLIIPFNGDQAKLTEEAYDDIAVVAQSSAVTTYDMGYSNSQNLFSDELFVVDEEIYDPQGFYTPSTSTYENSFFLQGSNTLRFEVEIDYDIIVNNDTGGDVNLLTNLAGWKLVTIGLNNGVPVPGALVEPTTSYTTLANGTLIPPGDYVVGNNNVTYNLDFPNQNIGTNNSIGFTLRRQILVLYTGNIVLPMKLRINSIKYKIIPNVQTMAFSFPVFLNAFVPKKVKQSDFIKAFVTLYNLYIEVDPYDSNNLIIKSRDEYYDDGKTENWTKLLNKDMAQELQFLPELNKKKLKLTYKDDDKDEALKAYTQVTEDVYGEVEFTFDNEYIKDEEKKEIIFSPTIITDTLFGAVTPSIAGVSPKNNIRLLYDAGMFNCSNWYIYDYGTTGTSGMTEYPLFSHMDDPYNPEFDINFGQCGYYGVNGLQLTNNNMYNLHWRRTLNQMNTSKMMTAFFDLKASDIQKMKLSDKIRIDNSWWNINNIQDYNPTKPGPTKVELLSIDDELKMVPFKVWRPPIGPVGPIVGPARPPIGPVGPIVGPARPAIGGWTYIDWTLINITKKRNSYTNVNLGTMSTLDGRYNVVGPNAKSGIVVGDRNTVLEKAFVFGNDNVVDDNRENVFIFGDDITASIDNSVVVKNLVISGNTYGSPYDFNAVIGDETTAITTGTAKLSFRMPRDMQLEKLKVSLTTTGSTTTRIDVNLNGTTLLSSPISLASGVFVNSTTSIATSNIAEDDLITVDIDAAGAEAKGCKVYLIGKTRL